MPEFTLYIGNKNCSSWSPVASWRDDALREPWVVAEDEI
jgi:hypothetical protein